MDIPTDFPSRDTMFSIIKKTIEKSWLVDLDFADVEKWLCNFKGDVYSADLEQAIALWMLCHYTYYNDRDVDYLCKILYKYFLHDIIINYHISTNEEILAKYQNMFFSSLGSASESGGLLLYHFRQQANLSIDRFFLSDIH